MFDAVNVEQIVSSSGHTDPQPTTSRSKVNVIKIVFELNLNFFLLGGVHFDSLFRFKIKVDLHFDVLKKKLKKFITFCKKLMNIFFLREHEIDLV